MEGQNYERTYTINLVRMMSESEHSVFRDPWGFHSQLKKKKKKNLPLNFWIYKSAYAVILPDLFMVRSQVNFESI